jgi:hypothetical protein
MLSKKLSSESLFFQNILCYFISLHAIPLRSYVEENVSNNDAKLITLITSFDEFITINLNELPNPTHEELNKWLTYMLINSCYEIAKGAGLLGRLDLERRDFFRYIRNAASHGGKFTFLDSNSPHRLATWKNIEISEANHNDDMFNVIAIGDVVLFLQEIDSSNWENVA